MHTYKYTQFTKGSPLVADASDLGIPVGEIPKEFAIDGYEGEWVFHHAPPHQNGQVWVYVNRGDCLAPDVHIFND